MITNHTEQLLKYLDTLASVQGAGHYVNEEIKEVVKEIRIELGLEQKKRDTLKASRKLIFDAKIGKPTFRQNCLFEAVFGTMERSVTIPYLDVEKESVEKAIKVLQEMDSKIHISKGIHVFGGFTVEVRRV